MGLGSLKKTLEGHTAPVLSCAWRYGYNDVLSGGADAQLKLWDTELGTCTMNIVGHNSPIKSVAFTPDGETAISAGKDVIKTWWCLKIDKIIEEKKGDTYTECESELTGHNGAITWVAANVDDATIATASVDNSIKLWFLDAFEAKIEACFNTMTGHKSKVNMVAFAGDGRRLATVGDGMVGHVMWASNGGSHMTNLCGPSANLSSVAWSKQGRIVITGSEDGKIGMWNIDLYDRLAETTQMKNTALGTYNDDSCKNIVQS